MSIERNLGVLTIEMYDSLKQGDKIRFRWYGNKSEDYIGRVEINRWGVKYWCGEWNYEGDQLIPHCKGMQFYNSLVSFNEFTEFEILKS